MADRADPLGFDLFVGPVAGGGVDMAADGRSCSGLELVINKLIARSMATTLPLTGAPGGIVDYGEDVRGWVGSPMTTSSAASRAQRLTIVYGRIRALDPGSIAVHVSAQGRGAQYDVTVQVSARTTDARPVELVLGVNGVTVDLLAQGT